MLTLELHLYPLYIFDLDGTLNRGDAPIPYAADTVNQLRDLGAKIRFVTNNSTKTREFVAEKLNRLIIIASPEEVVTSATGTATYCKQNNITKIGVVGEQGLVDTLRKEELTAYMPNDNWPALDSVVVGLFRNFTYDHINKAMQNVLKGAKFIATNCDPTFPVENRMITPGAGVLVSAIKTCTGKDPYVIGKPSPFLTVLAMQSAGVKPEETLVVGDRMDTDIESGIAAGANTHLVLTGVTTTAPSDQHWSTDLRALLE